MPEPGAGVGGVRAPGGGVAAGARSPAARPRHQDRPAIDGFPSDPDLSLRLLCQGFPSAGSFGSQARPRASAPRRRLLLLRVPLLLVVGFRPERLPHHDLPFDPPAPVSPALRDFAELERRNGDERPNPRPNRPWPDFPVPSRPNPDLRRRLDLPAPP
ncbi:hypothetical protein [Salinispora arenicola]|uniref:hypothetical protein n=1 Tax=Salinispora arenicola TaxID=168697 RepID=UPI00207A0288|nr:hypothetical protein [Salinispora arenicola]MCN0180705.1 hypothetical protein [Salinispora arenicola]